MMSDECQVMAGMMVEVVDEIVGDWSRGAGRRLAAAAAARARRHAGGARQKPMLQQLRCAACIWRAAEGEVASSLALDTSPLAMMHNDG